MTCVDLAKYYNICKCWISGDIGTDKITTHNKQSEGNYAEKIVISNIQMQMICDIAVLFGKWISLSNFIHTSHMTANNPFLGYWNFVSTNQRTVYIEV